MPRIVYRWVDGREQSVAIDAGVSVMAGALQHDLPGIDADCGGSCQCATCHVYVDDAWLAKLDSPGAAEQELLAIVAAPRRAGSRLSCQLEVSEAVDGMVVTIPETQQF